VLPEVTASPAADTERLDRFLTSVMDPPRALNEKIRKWATKCRDLVRRNKSYECERSERKEAPDRSSAKGVLFFGRSGQARGFEGARAKRVRWRCSSAAEAGWFARGCSYAAEAGKRGGYRGAPEPPAVGEVARAVRNVPARLHTRSVTHALGCTRAPPTNSSFLLALLACSLRSHARLLASLALAGTARATRPASCSCSSHSTSPWGGPAARSAPSRWTGKGASDAVRCGVLANSWTTGSGTWSRSWSGAARRCGC
jgi:hypothetical protein